MGADVVSDSDKETFSCHGFDGPCVRKDARKNRQRTAYVNREKNFVILCPRCQKLADECWDERWYEYYISV